MSGSILRRQPVTFVIAATVVAAACGPRAPETTLSGVMPFPIAPTKTLTSTPSLLAVGKKRRAQRPT